MLTRALIIVGLLAAALVALALAVVAGRNQPGGAGALGQPLIPGTIWEAAFLEITPPPERGATLTLERRPEGWVLARDGWPANEPAVRATLRLLGEVRTEGRGADLRDGTRIRIRSENGDETILLLESGDVSLGGRSLLANEGGVFGSASTELAQALGDISLDAWRSPAAMPRVEVEASRITIEAAQGPVTSLARTEGRWRVREPLRARADDRMIGAYLGALIDLRVRRFASPEDAAAAREQGPGAVALRSIVVETDRRRFRPEEDRVVTTMESTTLRVLGTLDDSGESVVCEVDGVALVVRAEALTPLATPAVDFLAPSSLGSTPADIGMIALRDAEGNEAAFRRSVTAWVGLGEAAERLLNPGEDPGAIDLVLQFLANAQPLSVTLAPDASVPAAGESSVRLYGLADDERGALSLRWEPAELNRTLVVRDEGVERRYSEGQTPRVLRAWLDGE